jgi:energy-coupling factor transporter ATP-binding protein EcfA2
MKTTFSEYGSVEVARNLMRMTRSEKKADFFLEDESDKDGKKYQWNYVLQKLGSICNQLIKNDGVITQSYRHGSHLQDGRLYSKNSIQGLPSLLRKVLTAGILRDYDMKNCHNVILLHLVKEHNKKYPENCLPYACLENYVKNRDDIFKQHDVFKQEMLMALNVDTITTQRKSKNALFVQNDFIKDFWHEKNTIYNRFVKLNEYKYETTNKKNPKSSYVNKILCRFENIFLQEALARLDAHGYEASILMFDGLMIGPDVSSILEILNTDSICEWVEKPNESVYEFPPHEPTTTKGSYADVKKYFEKNHFQLKFDCTFAETIINKNGELTDSIHSPGNFRTMCAPYKYIEDDTDGRKGEYSPFFDRWIEDDERRCYNEFTFQPYAKDTKDSTPDYIYNQFRPFKAELIDRKITEDEVKWFTDFLLENICNSDKKVFSFMMKYVAHIMQYPAISMKICLVIRGSQGCGKDTLIEILSAIFGRDRGYIHNTGDIEDCFGQFTTSLKNKLVVVLNEVKSRDGHALTERLKEFTTRHINMINEKYRQPYDQTNMSNLILFSNNLNVVNIQTTDRRIVLLKTSDKWKGDAGYWDEVYSHVENVGDINILFTYLCQYDVEGFSAKDERPETKEYKALKQVNIPTEIQFFQSLVYGTDESEHFHGFSNYSTVKTPKCKIIQKRQFFELANEFIRQQGCDFKVKSSRWLLMLSECDGCRIDFRINGIKYLQIFPEQFTRYIDKKYPSEDDDDIQQVEVDLEDEDDDEKGAG